MEVLSQVVVGAHFYQPDRLARHPNLANFTTSPDQLDWSLIANQRVYARLAELNLYPFLSYDLAPPLRRELGRLSLSTDGSEANMALTSMNQHLGENGIATTAIHAILPHLSLNDQEILITAGINEHRLATNQDPLVFWPPEGAINLTTLKIIAIAGIKAIICAPEQINSSTPRKIELTPNLTIYAIPFDSTISREIAFDKNNRTDAKSFTEAHIKPEVDKRHNQSNPYPIVIFSDGETYGMYDKQKENDPTAHGSDRFLNYLVKQALHNIGAEIISINEQARQLPSMPVLVGQLVDNSAWSCSDSLVRWNGERDCAESSGSAWKKPFYQANKILNQQVTSLIRHALELDSEADNQHYVNLIATNFNDAFLNGTSGPETSSDLALISAKVAALACRASCGTFFDNPNVSGWQNFAFARAAIEYLKDAGAKLEAENIWREYLSYMQQMPSEYYDSVVVDNLAYLCG